VNQLVGRKFPRQSCFYQPN